MCFAAAGIDHGLSRKQILDLFDSEGDGRNFQCFGYGYFEVNFFWVKVGYFVDGNFDGVFVDDAFGHGNLDTYIGGEAKPNNGISFHADAKDQGWDVFIIQVNIVPPGEIRPVVVLR